MHVVVIKCELKVVTTKKLHTNSWFLFGIAIGCQIPNNQESIKFQGTGNVFSSCGWNNCQWLIVQCANLAHSLCATKMQIVFVLAEVFSRNFSRETLRTNLLRGLGGHSPGNLSQMEAFRDQFCSGEFSSHILCTCKVGGGLEAQ